MTLNEFKDQGKCTDCQFYGIVDVDGRKDCMFHWFDNESEDWNMIKNCDEIKD